jgi:hypothetical protein
MAERAQLSLDELADNVMHRLAWLAATETGYRARCVCGRISDEKRTKAEARGAQLAHVARTPYGRQQIAKLYR